MRNDAILRDMLSSEFLFRRRSSSTISRQHGWISSAVEYFILSLTSYFVSLCMWWITFDGAAFPPSDCPRTGHERQYARRCYLSPRAFLGSSVLAAYMHRPQQADTLVPDQAGGVQITSISVFYAGQRSMVPLPNPNRQKTSEERQYARQCHLSPRAFLVSSVLAACMHRSQQADTRVQIQAGGVQITSNSVFYA